MDFICSPHSYAFGPLFIQPSDHSHDLIFSLYFQQNNYQLGMWATSYNLGVIPG